MSRHFEPSDGVDQRREQWRQEEPDVDTRGMAILGRARLLTVMLRPQIEAVFAKHGLDSGEFDVLATLLRSGPPYRLRPTELFRSLMISSAGLTDRLARLTKAGLVARKVAPTDARSMLVELTASGRDIARRAFQDDMALEAALVSTLSDADQEALAKLLRRLLLAQGGVAVPGEGEPENV